MRWQRSSGNTISYTPLGRAYNRHNPALGQTMNAAMLAVIYGNAIAPPNATDVEVVRLPRALQSAARACVPEAAVLAVVSCVAIVRPLLAKWCGPCADIYR